jgi:hypothetical protein
MVIQGLEIFLTSCSLMRNGSTYTRNLKMFIYYLMKTIHIGLVRIKTSQSNLTKPYSMANTM